MTRYAYVAEAAGGAVIRGRVEADSERAVIDALSADRLRPLSIKPLRGEIRLGRRTASMPVTTQSRLVKRLAELLSSSIPLADALALMGRGEAQEAATARSLLASVRSGQDLSSSFALLASPPPAQLLALVAVGEETGTLAQQLSRLAEELERKVALRRDIIGQLVYPAALLVLILLTLVFLAHLVLPQFEAVFAGSAAVPPPETRFVLAAGRFVREWGALFPLAALLLVLVCVASRRAYRDTFDSLLLRLPFVGRILARSEAARFCRALGALTAGGCGLAKALPLARQGLTFPVLRRRHANAADAVRSGLPLSTALGRETLLHDEALQLVLIGERTGRLGQMLLQAAETCEAEVTASLKKATALTGPVLTALMGLLTAGVIASVMTGVLSLNDAVY
ncbi:type II secretion system F family protein [Parvularcula oceani]|uniref:type II secretion system F family protein n=1 Tax=Parvularcula oceani TaxID=1247963 RepID=UPI0004E197B1|nr:type II secretion system F family protein [Parvularcula oceani]